MERFLEITRTNNPRRLKYLAFVLLLGLTGDFSLNLSHPTEVTAVTENILETIRNGVQDFVAPEVRRSRRMWGPWVKRSTSWAPNSNRSLTPCKPSSTHSAQRLGRTSAPGGRVQLPAATPLPDCGFVPRAIEAPGSAARGHPIGESSGGGSDKPCGHIVCAAPKTRQAILADSEARSRACPCGASQNITGST